MEGKILDYNIQESSGLISSDDGNRYAFSNHDWKSSDNSPKQGDHVDFTVKEETATDIYLIKSHSTTHTSSTSSAAVISMIFGILGLLSTWWLLGIPSFIAIITGHIARSNIAKSQGKTDGDGMALIGLILGYIVIVIYLSIIFLFAGLIASISKT